MNIYDKLKIKSSSFTNIELEKDNSMFIDPFLIYKNNDELSHMAKTAIKSYFGLLLTDAINKDDYDAKKLTLFLSEINYTRLGYSKGKINGKGFSSNNGLELYELIKNSKAVGTGLISDIFDVNIMINNVNNDKVSDLVTNIILSLLADYTLTEAKKYSIPLFDVKRMMWDINDMKWEERTIKLPCYNGLPLVLVPKIWVTKKSKYSYLEYYDKVMLPLYEKEALRSHPTEGLVKILKDGRIKPLKGEIKKKYKPTKENVVEHILTHPDLYKDFKYKEIEYKKINE